MNWLDADLASRTIEDRLAMYHKYLDPAEVVRFGIEHDRIQVVEDRDGDGKADHSTVFADGFNCDYRGTPNLSGIRSFANRPSGASFELVDAEQPVWGTLPTDIDFGTDGALYFSDWVMKVEQPGEERSGRIYCVTSATGEADPETPGVRKLLAEGMDGRSVDELAGLLAHRDMRVRQEAQFALVASVRMVMLNQPGKRLRPGGLDALQKVARENGNPLARLHAIWGLGQVGRHNSGVLDPLVALLNDEDAEVRAQAAKVLGEGRQFSASPSPALIKALGDESPRVRFFAAASLGKLGTREAIGPLLAMLRANADSDAYLRHAGVMGLAGIGDVAALLAAAADESSAVRLGVLLALRRLGRPELARFLNDPQPNLVLEAARAINDVPIAAALPSLAALAVRPDMSEPLLRRILNANVCVGGPTSAAALVGMAGQSELPATVRAEALDALGQWANPSGRDRIVGLWRPLAPRPAQDAARALEPALSGLLGKGPEPIRQAAARAAGALEIHAAGPALVKLVRDGKRPPATRIEALRACERLNDPDLAALVAQAVDDPDRRIRGEALRLLAVLRPEAAIPRLESMLARGSVAERQGAFHILGTMTGPASDTLLTRWLERLDAGSVPPELQLDLLEAAKKHPAPEITRLLNEYESDRSPDDPLAPYRETLLGGNAESGRKIFFQKADVSCVRCHKIGNRGGEVGPDLSRIGALKDRSYVLEAVVAPSRQIAEGFESRVIATSDGQVHVGVFKGETPEAIRLMTAEGKSVVIPKSDIEEQKRGDSAMPGDLAKLLSKSELRDLVEFLARQKAMPAQPNDDDTP